MSESTSRRSFITKGAAVGAASLFAGKKAEAAPDMSRKLKIGVIGVDSTSFMTYCWADIIEGTKTGSRSGNFGMPFLNMEITQVWDKDPKAAQDFANRLSIPVAKKYDEMLGKIDGIIFAGMDDVRHMKTLAKPYLEAGVPTYLSRPFAYSLRDIDDILESAAKGNTPIIATAKFEHYKEVPALQSKIKNVGRIAMVQVDASSSDFPMHLHVQFMMLKMLGYDVKQVSLIADNDFKANYIQESYIYPGNDTQPPYICTINGGRITDAFHVRIVGNTGIEEASFLRGYDWQEYGLLHRYAPQVIDMQRTFYGKNYEPYDIVRKKTEIFLTAYYSYLERGGAPVDVGTVPVDWRVNSPNLNTKPEF